ncbi:MAG: hypothetical protein KIS67_02450 [Verrucomicrobiae bacterium]|nr:hypothetical protein [Verrucomicrobiae bacterium]
MTLDRYETSADRHRLSGRTESRGSRTGFSTLGAFVFGGVFVLVGTLIIFVGTKVIPVDPKGVHAPYWVLTVFGAIFALAGLMVWGMAGRQYTANRRRKEVMQRHAGEPAVADYDWNPQGYAVNRWRRPARALGGAAFVTLFLSIFNYWGFWTQAPWMVKAIVILFDLILLAVWWQALLLLGRAIKFGGSRIEFAEFPFRLTKPVVVRWQPATGIARARRGSFTLRCVEEWFESHGSGKNRSTRMVHEQKWSGTWFLDREHTFQPQEDIELRFEPGADALPTHLHAARPVFWELEVKLDLPGLDFEETYLVPVYAGG